MIGVCIACHSSSLEKVERVPIDAIASLWAEDNRHGRNHDFDTLRSFIAADLKSDHVEFWQCTGCGLESSHPMVSWSEDHYPHEEHSLGFDHQVATAFLREMSPRRVLDIGCADGQFLEVGMKRGHRMAGLDFSREDVEAGCHRGLDIRHGDVGSLTQIFAGEKFDVITLFQLIEHLKQPDEVFEQLEAVAEKDCMLIVGCPSPVRYTRSFDHHERVSRSDFWDYPPQHTLRWTSQALKTFLARHGWSTEDVLYEPVSLRGAAAHLTCLNGLTSDWYRIGWRRRLKTAQWMLKIAPRAYANRLSGIRMVVNAVRSGC